MHLPWLTGLLVFSAQISSIISETRCAEFIGRIYCSDKERMKNTVVELWDKDCDDERNRIYNDDDLVSTYSYAFSDTEEFKITGCGSDPDILMLKNSPEFFIKVKHNCRGKNVVQNFYPDDMKVFAPNTNHYFDEWPIYLD